MVKALIVEDEIWVRKGIIKIIKWHELNMEMVGEAENGEEALHMIQLANPDLIITDMKMPKCSGIDFLKKLEFVMPECEIIIISGHSDYEYMRQAISSRVFEYILKPVDESELNNVLKRVLLKIKNKKKEEEDKISIRSRLDVSRELLEENVLNSLVNDTFCSNEVLAWKADEVNLDYSYFAVASVLFKNALDKKDILGKNFFTGIKIEIMKEFPRIDCNVFKSGHSPFEMVILLKSNEHDAGVLTNEYKQIIGFIYELFSDKYSIDLRIGAGTLKNSVYGISEGYKESIEALKYEHLNEKDIVFHEDIKELNDQEDFYFIDEKQLYVLLENASEEEIKKMMESLFFDIYKNTHKYCKVSSIRKAVIDMMLAFERFCYKSAIEFHADVLLKDNYIDRVEALNSIRELKIWIQCALGKILDYIRDERKGNNDVIQDIKSYIEKNYDQDINLINLSKKYFMSHIYLSRLFKARTGENFINYLSRVRMTKAKELIERGGLKIKEVAKLSGYSNPYYFSTSYKKFFGIPPSDS